MPRNEGFLDPDAGPLASFAWDLRALREKAGKVPYRVLAKRAGFCASTLSVAASGARLPSLDVTLAYVQACGGNPEEWQARWHQLAAEHPPAHPGPNAQQAEPGLQVAPPYDADEHGGEIPDIPDSLAVAEIPMMGDYAAADMDEGVRVEAVRSLAVSETETPAAPSVREVTDGGSGWRAKVPMVSAGRVAAVAVVLATAILSLRVAVPAATGGTPAASPPTPSASRANTPMQQADDLYAVIYEFIPLRSDTADAIWDVDGCRNLSNAQSRLRNIARKRQEQVEQLKILDVSKLPGSARLVKALTHAWITSAQTDTAYANIAADLQTGCTSGAIKTDPSYQQADADAQAAEVAKAEAAQLWNANADELGQLRISEAEL